MRFSIAASLLASGVAAFSDSSPFVLFSTSELPPLPEAATHDDPQLRSASQVLQTTRSLLAACPTARYVLVAQPDLHASDLRDAHTGACLARHLCAGAAAPRVRARFDVAEVVGPALSAGELRAAVEGACAARGPAGWGVVEYQLDGLPPRSSSSSAVGGGVARAEAVAAGDEALGKILRDVEEEEEEGDGDGGYTVIYFSSPHEAHLRNYESEFVVDPAVAPMELKRRSAEVLGEGVGRRAGSGNSTSAPLFVKYQFFTPGIFMGLVGTIIMLMMLYVGLSAVSSLQVSYGAFDKENGPAAQKKNM